VIGITAIVLVLALVFWPLGMMTGPKPSYKCGADITSQFYIAINTVKRELSRKFKDPDTKARICGKKGIYSKGVDGWDFDAFHRDDYRIGEYPSDYYYRCKNRVTFAGKCYNKWELNYYLWGLLNRMCDNSWRKTDFFANWAYVRYDCPEDPVCKNQFAKAGYFGNLAYIDDERCSNDKTCSTGGAPRWSRSLSPYYKEPRRNASGGG
jgi:hypothetical protein